MVQKLVETCQLLVSEEFVSVFVSYLRVVNAFPNTVAPRIN